MKIANYLTATLLIVCTGWFNGHPMLKASSTPNLKVASGYVTVTRAVNPFATTQTMCAGPIPAGWLLQDSYWNPTSCGNPTTIISNVYVIVRYDNLPSGSVLSVCTQSIPTGWVQVSTNWCPTCCGKPTQISNNVMQIKKL